MKLKSLFPAFFFFFSIIFPSLSFAQSAPDFVFAVTGRDPGSSAVISQVPATSWSFSNSSTSPYTSLSTISGSASPTSATSSGERSASGSISGWNSAGGYVKSELSLYSRVKGSVEFTFSSSLNASITTDHSGGGSASGSASGSSSALATVSAPGSDADSDQVTYTELRNLSCSPGASTDGCTSFAEYPGEVYCKVPDAQNLSAGSHISQSGSASSFDASSTHTITLSAIIGQLPPSISHLQVIADGELVDDAGTKKRIDIGDDVVISTTVIDPDDQNSTNLAGICDISWVIEDRLGETMASGVNTNTSFPEATVGRYKLIVTATDNEGETVTSETYLPAGYEKPGDSPGDPITALECDGGNSASGAPTLTSELNQRNGNSRGTYRSRSGDTSLTGLANDIFIVSESTLRRVSSMGNASHSYSMHSTTGLDHKGVSRRFIIDRNGNEFEFGDSSGPIAKGRTVFSDFEYIVGGSRVFNAGPPEAMNYAGNYSYEFNLNGSLVKITDPSGNITQVTRNVDDTISEVENLVTGRKQTYEYDVAGKVARIVEGAGYAVTHLTYTSNDLLTKIERKDSLGNLLISAEFFYNGNDRISKIRKDGDSDTDIDITYDYLIDGLYTANMSDQSGYSSNLEHFKTTDHPSGAYETRRENAQGGTFRYVFDEEGNLVATIEEQHYKAPSGSTPTQTFTRDSNGLLLSSSNGRKTVNYTYNSLGLLTQKQVVGGQVLDLTYSGSDLISVADQDGTIASFAYTDISNPHSPTTMTDGGGLTWTYAYNAEGQVTSVTPPTGSVTGATTYSYYSTTAGSPNYKRLESVTNGAGDVVTYDSYSELGDVLSVTTSHSSGNYNTTQYDYDEARRLLKITHPDTKTQQWSYVGRFLDTYLDENANLTQYEWCKGCGKATKQTFEEGKELEWEYNSDRALTKFTDGVGGENTYTYGLAGEVKTQRYDDNKGVSYFRYDQYGMLERVKKTNGKTVRAITRDSHERVTNLQGVEFGYHHDGRLDWAEASGVDTEYTYDSSRRVSEIEYDFSSRSLSALQKLEYTYTPDGLISTMTWKDNGTTVVTWTYTYDSAGRMTQVSNTIGQSFTYTYDDEGKILSQINNNGTETHYTYNNDRGWVTQIDHKKTSTGLSFETYDLTYDGGLNTVGNITKIDELDGSVVNYVYDDLDRLTSESRTGTHAYTKTFTYDEEGNIITIDGSPFATYDDSNKISTLSVPGGYFNYDSYGNLYQISGSGYQYRHYQYGSFDEVTRLYATGQYAYYYHNERMLRAVRKRSGSSTAYYIYSGNTVVGERLRNGEQIVYTHGPDGLAGMKNKTTNAVRVYHFGPQGETRRLTSNSGSFKGKYYYEAYGRQISETNTTTFNPYQYGGKYGYYKDEHASSLLAGWRWYMPRFYRWANRDPIKFAGGSNTYQYVGGNPVKYVDPDGKIAPAVAVGGGALVVGGAGLITCYLDPNCGVEELGQMLEDVSGSAVEEITGLLEEYGGKSVAENLVDSVVRGFCTDDDANTSEDGGRSREKSKRMTDRDDPLQQIEEIEEAQRKFRQGKGQKRIDSIKKSRQRAEKRLKDIAQDPDWYK